MDLLTGYGSDDSADEAPPQPISKLNDAKRKASSHAKVDNEDEDDLGVSNATSFESLLSSLPAASSSLSSLLPPPSHANSQEDEAERKKRKKEHKKEKKEKKRQKLEHATDSSTPSILDSLPSAASALSSAPPAPVLGKLELSSLLPAPKFSQPSTDKDNPFMKKPNTIAAAPAPGASFAPSSSASSTTPTAAAPSTLTSGTTTTTVTTTTITPRLPPGMKLPPGIKAAATTASSSNPASTTASISNSASNSLPVAAAAAASGTSAESETPSYEDALRAAAAFAPSSSTAEDEQDAVNAALARQNSLLEHANEPYVPLYARTAAQPAASSGKGDSFTKDLAHIPRQDKYFKQMLGSQGVDFLHVNGNDLTQKTMAEELMAAYDEKKGLPPNAADVKVTAKFWNSQTGREETREDASAVSKRKHQINSLAQNAAAIEVEMIRQRQAGYAKRDTARKKYGW